MMMQYDDVRSLGQTLIKLYLANEPNTHHLWTRFFVHVEKFKFLYIEGNNKEINVFLQDGDEIIEYNLTQDKHKKVVNWIEDQIFKLEEEVLLKL